MIYIKIFVSFLSLTLSLKLYANKGPETGLDIPRFVALKSSDVNLRVGPSLNYPINIKYIKINLPIEITDEFDAWRKIKDYDNNIGWIHKSLIKGDRFIISGTKKTTSVNIYNRPRGKIIGNIKKNNILNLKSCLINWCNVYNDEIAGWVSKNKIWGVYETEIYNKSFYQPIISYYWKILDKNWLK